MATATPTKVSVNLKLNNGIDPEGNTKTVSVSMGKLSLTGFDINKAYAVAQLITPILAKPLHRIEKVDVSTITA